MKGMKQILLAGFAALCMVLPACHTAIPGEEFARRLPLVISSEPLNTVSYTAEYTQDGAQPFTCEVKLASDNRIRRDYVWKDEKGAEKKVSEILSILNRFKSLYFEQGIFPELYDKFEIQLFNTFCGYIDHTNFFPFKLKKNSDDRGTFVETVKLDNIGGQISFSTTKPGITRGNHFHTRKIERFAVICGMPRIFP